MTEALQCLYPAGSVGEYQALREEYKQQFLQLDTTPSPLFSETPALLSQLRNEKYLLAVATGKARAGLERVLRETGLGEFFMPVAAPMRREVNHTRICCSSYWLN